MRVNKLSISVVLALLWACVTEPPQTLLQPRVESLKGEAGCDYISLEAVLENAENITSAGFYLWADNNEKQRKECLPNGNRIAASFTGLTPATSYQYAAFIANGKDEILSQIKLLTTERLQLPEFAVQIETSVEPDYYSALIKADFQANYSDFTCGFLYGPADSPESNDGQCHVSGSSILYEITGLEPNTQYAFRAYFKREDATIMSERCTFNTLRIPVPGIEEIDVAINTDSATLIARLSNTSHLTSAGFILGSSEESASKIVVPLIGNTLTYTWENLSSDMEYSFRVFCENGYEMVESAPQVFKTAKLVFEPGLLTYLIENFDADDNGIMSQSELQGITEIVLSDIYLESLDGLETLVNLKSLSMGNNWLETIDLSANKKLEFFSGGRDPHLKHIIIDNPQLYYLYLLQADNLKTIDLAHCPKLSNFECYGVKLETMDFSHNGQLQVVFIHESNLKELDLSSNWNLRHLGSHDNLQLETIWLKEGIMMESLEIDSHTQIQYR